MLWIIRAGDGNRVYRPRLQGNNAAAARRGRSFSLPRLYFGAADQLFFDSSLNTTVVYVGKLGPGAPAGGSGSPRACLISGSDLPSLTNCLICSWRASTVARRA